MAKAPEDYRVMDLRRAAAGGNKENETINFVEGAWPDSPAPKPTL